MSLKNTIEKLFEEDLLGSENPMEVSQEEIPLLDASEPVPPVLHEKGGIEKRNFSRAELGSQQIELKFTNQAHFAKRYIDNISLGGLFVKTTEKFKSGEIIPIHFAVPSKDGSPPKEFNLHGKVCRIREDGVGLEFTNLTASLRLDLEAFVRSTLPKDTHVFTKAKQSTIDRLDLIREKREIEQKKFRKRWLQVTTIVILLAANAFFAAQSLIEPQNFSEYRENAIQVNGKSIFLRDIESISKEKNGEIVLNLQNNQAIPLPRNGIEKALPYHLRHTVQLLQKLKPKKRKRMSKNATRHSRLR